MGMDDDDELVEAWESAGAKILVLSEAGVLPGRMPVVPIPSRISLSILSAIWSIVCSYSSGG